MFDRLCRNPAGLIYRLHPPQREKLSRRSFQSLPSLSASLSADLSFLDRRLLLHTLHYRERTTKPSTESRRGGRMRGDSEEVGLGDVA